MKGKRLKPAVFLDRDGTIIEDRGNLAHSSEIEIYPFSFSALKMLQKNYLLFIVTNQSGVGLGKVSMEEVSRVNEYLLSVLRENGIMIQRLYCCSHKRDDQCRCIKPNPYFIHEAMKEYNLDISKSFSIGDHPHDVTFGKFAGGTGLYVLTGHGRKHLNEIENGTLCFENLYDAANWIDKLQVKESDNAAGQVFLPKAFQSSC